jgi:hypothetical protein
MVDKHLESCADRVIRTFIAARHQLQAAAPETRVEQGAVHHG